MGFEARYGRAFKMAQKPREVPGSFLETFNAEVTRVAWPTLTDAQKEKILVKYGSLERRYLAQLGYVFPALKDNTPTSHKYKATSDGVKLPIISQEVLTRLFLPKILRVVEVSPKSINPPERPKTIPGPPKPNPPQTPNTQPERYIPIDYDEMFVMSYHRMSRPIQLVNDLQYRRAVDNLRRKGKGHIY